MKNRDRIIILEDTDGDGRHDKRTVFWDKGNSLSGIEYGFGGVWVCCAPHLLFIPDKNGDDVPDGEPEIVLDGWTTKAKHNVFNGLTWGPDGWLYGCHGILATSRVGRPGTPDDKRVTFNCGVWRYHPTRKTFEVVCPRHHQSLGPRLRRARRRFLHQLRDRPCLSHDPRRHYKRMYGQDLNPHVYELMDSASDHLHWGGGHWSESRQGAQHDAPGGGHAHSGCSSTSATTSPRSTTARSSPATSTATASTTTRWSAKAAARSPNTAPTSSKPTTPGSAASPWRMGPDGGMYITDWTDTGECHDYDKCIATVDGFTRSCMASQARANVDLGNDQIPKTRSWNAIQDVRLCDRTRDDYCRNGSATGGTRSSNALVEAIAAGEREVPIQLRKMCDAHSALRCYRRTLDT